MNIRLQDLPDISDFVSESDKVMIIKPNTEGLTALGNLTPYEAVDAKDEEN